MKERHQQKLAQTIKSAEGSAGLLHKISQPTARRGGARILKKEEEDARLLDRCEATRKEWAKHWQCDESVQNVKDKPLNNEKLRKLEEALPRLKECEKEKMSRLYKGKDGSGVRWLPPKSSSGFDKRNKKKSGGVIGKGGTGHDKPVRGCSS